MYQVTNVAFGSTGAQSIPTDFTAKGYKITLIKKIGTTQNNSALSVGWCNGTNGWCESFWQTDASAGRRFQSGSKVISHYESQTSEVVNVAHSGITGGGSPSIDVSITATNANYNWNVEYWNDDCAAMNAVKSAYRKVALMVRPKLRRQREEQLKKISRL